MLAYYWLSLAEITYGGAAPESWSVLMNVTLGIGGTLAIVAGVLFITIIGMTIIAGKKLATSEVPQGLAAPELVVKREIKYTPTALIPGILFVLVVLALTVAAFGIINGWPIQFG